MAQVVQSVGGRKRKSYETDEWLRGQQANRNGTERTQSKNSNYESRLKELHKNDDRPGKPTSTSTKKQQANVNKKSAYEKRVSDLHKNDDRPGKPTYTSTAKQTKSVLEREFKNAEKKTKTPSKEGSAGGAKKGTWNKEQVMAERRAAAQAQGKGNWNKEEVMRQRREAAAAKKKGK